MGTMTMFEETRKTIDNKKLEFNAWTFLDDIQCPEEGVVNICVRESGTKKDAPYWALSICLKEFDERWLERWVEAFCSQPSYRVQFVATDDDNDGEFTIPRERIDKKTGEILQQSTLPSIPKLPAQDAVKTVSNAVAKLVKLGSKARFGDFAELRSGRDAFSSIKLPVLLEMLGEKAAELTAMDLEDENKVKVARWAMRGLPMDMALHKVKVDLEISENAQKKRSNSGSKN